MNELITERPNLFEPNVYITLCTIIAGAVCLTKLTAAIREAYNANEATMSRIILTNGIARYEKLAVSGCKIEITDKDWLEIVKINEKIPFALDKGELVRAFLVPSKNETKVILMAHHLVGDGKSVVYFMKDIMNALAGVLLSDKPLALFNPKAYPKARMTIPARLFLRGCKRSWQGQSYSWQDYYDLHKSYWETASSEIRYETLSAAQTKQIIDHAKEIGCSVNSYMVTRFLQIYRYRGVVGIPVSIRQSGNEAMSNLTSAISIRYQFDKQKTFAQNATLVHRKIKGAIRHHKLFVLQFLAELPPTLIDAVLLNTHLDKQNNLVQRTAAVMGYAGGTKRNLGITNLTVLDIPTIYGKYQIENIIFVPPAVSYADHIIGISTINQKMTISYHNMKETCTIGGTLI